MHQLAHGFWLGFRHLVMPGVCRACHKLLPVEADDFCSNCLPQFTVDPFPSCPHCSSTIGPHADTESGCAICRKESFVFERAIRFGPYQGLLRDLILQMKHPGQEGLAEAVGNRWAQRDEDRLHELRADLVMPVPLHWRRRWHRGYNQSEALAQAIACRLALPCHPAALRRLRATPPQTTLTATDRRQNLRGAFALRRGSDLKDKTVLLIDDVMTSGSTVNECAKVIRTARAKTIVVAVLAHDGRS